MESDKIKKIKKYVFGKLLCPAHKPDHIERVYNLCLKLAKRQEVDLEVLKAAALLHDVGVIKENNDPTGKTNHAFVGSEIAGSFLKRINFPKEKIKHVQECILSHRFKTDIKPVSAEAKILFDADKIDTLGAIGVARAFVWVGKNQAYLFKKGSIKSYSEKNLTAGKFGRIKDKSKHSPQIEYEIKTRHIPSTLYTINGKKLARKRLRYYKEFLDQLEKEYFVKD